MKAIIQVHVPTVYQYGSIKMFGLPITKQPDGSYFASETFLSKKDARLYLLSLAEKHHESAKELRRMRSDILSNDCLRLDAAMANII